MSQNQTSVNLLVMTNPDGSPFFESVLVEELGEKRYRVLATPGLLEGFAAGDEIELAPEESHGFRVTKRGGNIGVQFFWTCDQNCCEEALELQVRALDV